MFWDEPSRARATRSDPQAQRKADMRGDTDRTDTVWDQSVYGEIADLLGPVRKSAALDLFEIHLRAGLALVRTVSGDGVRLAREAHGLVAMAGMLGSSNSPPIARRWRKRSRMGPVPKGSATCRRSPDAPWRRRAWPDVHPAASGRRHDHSQSKYESSPGIR